MWEVDWTYGRSRGFASYFTHKNMIYVVLTSYFIVISDSTGVLVFNSSYIL